MASSASAGLAALVAAAALATAAPLAAQADGAEARVAAILARRWDVPAAAIRLAWPTAAAPLALAGADSLRVEGTGTGGWLVVTAPDGVAVRVRAGVEDSVPVAARELSPGRALEAADIAVAVRVRWGAPRPDAAPGAGWEVRRPLAAGDPLAAPFVVPPPAVRGGDPLRLEWAQGGVQVSLSGVALHTARVGEPVRARVAGRSTLVSGIMTGPGLARLDGKGTL